MRLTTGYGEGKPQIWHARERTPDQRRQQHGLGAWQVPQPLTAGESATARFTFTLGQAGVATGGRLAIAWRWPFDWSALQAEDPAAPGYVTWQVHGAGGETKRSVQLRTVYHAYDGIEPFHHYLELVVEAGELAEGDRLEIVCGDTSAGSSGWRSPTCAIKQHDFLMLIAEPKSPRWTELLTPPPLTIQPGPPERLVVVAPADFVVGETQIAIVRLEDHWGNPTHGTSPPIWSPEQHGWQLGELRPLADPLVYHAEITAAKAGWQTLCASLAEPPLAGESGAIRVYGEPPPQRLFWGDLHAGQSFIGCGNGTLAEHYAFGRDAAGLQFITHQANDHYVTVADWEETRRVTEEYHEPRRYVPFLGCEWSPFTEFGGDRNVYYRHDEPRLRRSDRFFTEEHPDPEPDVPTAPEFHAAFAHDDVLVNMHVGGRMTNLKWHDPRIERLAECHSTHGTVDWFIRDCLERGYQVAVTAGTDGVMGRPGADQPGSRLVRNVANGLTGLWASELTREALWEALQARRTYGTTGERIWLTFEVNGHAMGSVCKSSGPVRIDLNVFGTAAIESITLFRGLETIHEVAVAPPATGEQARLRVLWSGTNERGTARRQRVDWHGSLSITGGTIRAADPLCFYEAVDELRQVSPQRLEWQSITAGNDAGVLLSIEGDENTVCRFESGPATFEFAPHEVEHAPLVHDAGGLSRRVHIGPAPSAAGQKHATLKFLDTDPPAGDAAYWCCVTQVDRGKAWSSPVYLTQE